MKNVSTDRTLRIVFKTEYILNLFQGTPLQSRFNVVLFVKEKHLTDMSIIF